MCFASCESSSSGEHSHVHQCCRGLNFRIGMYQEDWPPFHTYDFQTKAYGGAFVLVMEAVAAEMGMALEFVPSPENWPEDDLHRGVVDGVGVELSAPYVHHVFDEEEDTVYIGKIFTIPFLYSPVSGLVQKEHYKPSMWQLFAPFTTRLWYAILLSIFILSVASTLIFQVHGTEHPRGPRECCTDWCHRVYYAWSALLGGGEEFDSITTPARLLRLALLFLVVLITTTYTANLAAFLTEAHMEIKGPSALPDLWTSSVVCTPFDPTDPDGGHSFAIQSYAQNIIWPRHMPTTTELEESGATSWQDEERNDWCIQQVSEGAADIWVSDRYTVQKALFRNQNCESKSIAHWLAVSPIQFGLMLRYEDDDIARNITSAFQFVQQRSLHQQILPQVFDMDAVCPEDETSEMEQVDVIHMWGVFAICGSFVVVAVAIALIQRCMRSQSHATTGRSEDTPRTLTPTMSETEILQVIYGRIGEMDSKLDHMCARTGEQTRVSI